MREDSPVFIVGMPRSGTTLMRSLFNEHPNLAIAPETHYLTQWVGKYKSVWACWRDYARSERFSYLGIDSAAVDERIKNEARLSYRKVFDAILKEYGHSQGKPRLGEKTPGHYEHISTLFDWYPKCRVIWMVRDPRAVCASYLKVPWSKYGVLASARRWRSAMLELFNWKHDYRVLSVRFENLVKDTQKVLYEIYTFLDEPPIDDFIQNRYRSAIYVNVKNGWERYHLKNASGPVSSKPITKWHEELTDYQVWVIEQVGGALMRDHGYSKYIIGANFKGVILMCVTHLALLQKMLINEPKLLFSLIMKKMNRILLRLVRK